MIINESVGNEPVGSSLHRVATEPQKIQLSEVFVQPEDYDIRAVHESDMEDLKPLAEDIAVNGLITSLLVQDCGKQGYRLLDGHRRYFALKSLVENGVEGFEAAMLVPANVVSSAASQLDTTARAIAANVQRQSLSAEDRMRAAASLAKLGMPQAEIARCMAVSEATVARDLAVAGNDRLMEHIRRHHISATTAATLLKAAMDADRVDDFLEAFEDWLAETQATIEAEVDRRAANDEEPLSEAQRWPQRYSTADLARCWRSALQSGDELGSPTFRFKALVREDRGRTLLEIDPLRRDVAEMSAAELAKVFQRTVDLADALQPLVVDKAKIESAGSDPSAVATVSKGEDLLSSLGLGHLLDREEDDRFVDPDDVFPSAANATEHDVNVPRSPSRPIVEGQSRNDSEESEALR